MTRIVGYQPSSTRERGFTLVELLIVVGIIGIVAAIALPALLRARIAANEASAISSLRAIISAEKIYSQQCNSAYATSLTVLGTGSQPLMAPDLTASNPSIKSGYIFMLAPGASAVPGGAPACPGAQTAYYVTAVPVTPGATGIRAFAADSQDSIWQDSTGVAPTQPFTLGGSVTPIQ